MNFPSWYVPLIGSGWVIGIIAIIHVYISHFAIGGGLFLAMTERKALLENRSDWLAKLKGYSKFFLVLTGVAGAMTGVGIWFAIGLASPAGTSALIRNFVFAWAMEWVVFMVELALSALYYYSWDRISPKLHLKIGILYAITSFLTLFIINGILTFMLTPGSAWLTAAAGGIGPYPFWAAFFNPTFWPALFWRSLLCIALACIFALLFFSRLDGQREGATKQAMIRWSAKWIIPAFLLLPIIFAWYVWMIPSGQREILSFGVSTVGPGVFTQVTRLGLLSVLITPVVAGVVFLLAFLTPKDFKLGHAMTIALMFLVGFGTMESVREMLRKPYVIVDYMYSNGVRKSQVADFNRDGFLSRSLWSPGKSGGAPPDAAVIGRRVFLGQCLPCHTLDGYRGLKGLLKGRDERSIGTLLALLHEAKDDSPYRKFMPPLVGSDLEIQALRTYLAQQMSIPVSDKITEKTGR